MFFRGGLWLSLYARELIQFLQRAVEYVQIHPGINTIDTALVTVLPEHPFEPAARKWRLRARNILTGILRQPERIIFCPGWRSTTRFRKIILKEILAGIDDRFSAKRRF